MPKTLYNTETHETRPYPRADDEPVVGLDPVFDVLEITADPQPVASPDP